MPPVYRFIEIIVYSLLNFLPFLALALYPFRHSLRFSRGVTGILIGLLSVIQVLLGAWVSFVPGNHAAIASALSTALYAAFYFLAVKKHFGKTLFTLLMISNLANFAVISAKCIEGLLFPALAMQSYRWSFSMMLFAVEILLSVPIFLYMKSVFTPAVEKEPSGFEWRYLWLIPATFYIVWYFAIYSVVSRSALEIALHPKNTLFLFIINVGAILIYYVVTRLILEQNQTLELEEKKYLCFGGTESPDKEEREAGYNWWPQEMPSDEEYAACETNLEANGWQVDYVLTHDAPSRFLDFTSLAVGESNRLHLFLDKVLLKLTYEKWFFGCYHKDVALSTKSRCVFCDVIPMGERHAKR